MSAVIGFSLPHDEVARQKLETGPCDGHNVKYVTLEDAAIAQLHLLDRLLQAHAKAPQNTGRSFAY
jgi:hypothetical protein